MILLNHRYMIEKTHLTSFVVAVSSVLLASWAATSYIPGPASAQITPSTLTPDTSTSPPFSVLPKSLQSADTGIEFMPQSTASPVQNSTTTNITQLATIPPTVSQPITPSSLPISENSDDSNNSGDGDDENNSNNNDNDDDDRADNDGDDDDDSDDDDGGGNGDGSVAIAGGGGAFAFAG